MIFMIVSEEPLEELELAPPFVMMLCLEWIVVKYNIICITPHFRQFKFFFDKFEILLNPPIIALGVPE